MSAFVPRAGVTCRRRTLFRRIVDRLRSRRWQTVRDRAHAFADAHHGELFRDRWSGTFGTLIHCYPTRGNVIIGARIGAILETGHHATCQVPLADLRPATLEETGAFMLGQIVIRQAEERRFA